MSIIPPTTREPKLRLDVAIVAFCVWYARLARATRSRLNVSHHYSVKCVECRAGVPSTRKQIDIFCKYRAKSLNKCDRFHKLSHVGG